MEVEGTNLSRWSRPVRVDRTSEPTVTGTQDLAVDRNSGAERVPTPTRHSLGGRLRRHLCRRVVATSLRSGARGKKDQESVPGELGRSGLGESPLDVLGVDTLSHLGPRGTGDLCSRSPQTRCTTGACNRTLDLGRDGGPRDRLHVRLLRNTPREPGTSGGRTEPIQ